MTKSLLMLTLLLLMAGCTASDKEYVRNHIVMKAPEKSAQSLENQNLELR